MIVMKTTMVSVATPMVLKVDYMKFYCVKVLVHTHSVLIAIFSG